MEKTKLSIKKEGFQAMNLLKKPKSKKQSQTYQDETVSIRNDESCEILNEAITNRDTQIINNFYNYNAVNYNNSLGLNFPNHINLSEDIYSMNDLAGQFYSGFPNYPTNNLNLCNGSNFFSAGHPYVNTVNLIKLDVSN